MSRGGEEPDDWVARERWRRWDPPDADVALAPGAVRLLAPMLPAGGAAEAPVPAALVAEPGGTVGVEAGGYRVGRLAAGAAEGVAEELASTPSGRLAVPGLIVREGGMDAAPRVRLWAGRRLGGGVSAALESQREVHASRVAGRATPPGRRPARG